ncbi:MAG: phosphate/phosphite/phosphonate ABC transporter substrate-binding protein, partial [Proteobacteria bacterium]|nr:phosphate/phosphite/phosphonate ABC transporter substrate-binding protein [Pseudomonadota bacterium]
MITAIVRSLSRARALALAAVIVIAASAPARAQSVYLFAPVNQYGINLTAAYWNPILRYVSEKSGVKLALKVGRTSADTISYVLAREVEFAFANQLFTPEREKLGWKVFGSRDLPPIRGQIVVPADSPVSELTQLAGQEVAFAGPEAVVGYKLTYAHLLSKGINVNVVFGGNHDGAFSQLFSGKVKAAGGVSALVEGYAQREGRRFRVLWSSEPMHDLPLMVAPQVPPKDVRAVADAFFGMAGDPQGQEVLRKASAVVGLPLETRFVPSDGSEYDSYRRFYRSAPASLR